MERIGEYLVLRLLGEGGMGKVFEAEERLSKRRVALKLLKPELARSDEGRRLFLNEMTILSQLDHPNVVRCLCCSEVDGQLLMALEFLQGNTLRQHLTEHAPLAWNEAVSIVVQVAQGLRAAHRQTPSIVHRDLKPENIMLLDDGSVKVMDFGIAKVLEAMHKTTTQSVGTLQYMSPEQIDATGVDARSDLYCLGLVFYEMLSGRAPFDAASPRELLNRQCTEPPPPLPQQLRAALPRGVERLLLELLEKSPEQRPQTAAAVIRELEPFAPALGRSSAITEGLARPVDTAASKLDAKPAAPEQTLASNDSPQSAAASGRTPASARSARVQDTMELLESPRKPREITARTAWLTIVGLSLSAGMLTYWWRAADAASDIPGSAASTEQGPVRD